MGNVSKSIYDSKSKFEKKKKDIQVLKQRYHFENKVINLWRDVNITYNRLLLSKKKIEINQDRLDDILSMYSDTLTENETNQLKVKEYDTRKSISSEQSEPFKITSSFKGLLNTDRKIHITDSIILPNYKMDKTLIDSLYNRAITNQTRFERAEIENNKAEMMIQKRANYPVINTSARYIKSLESAYDGFIIAGGISVPLWDGGVSKLERKNAMLNIEKQYNNIENKQNAVRQWIENNYLNMLQYGQKVTPEDKRNIELKKEVFKNHDGSLKERLDYMEEYYTSLTTFYKNWFHAKNQEHRLRNTMFDISSPIKHLGRNTIDVKEILEKTTKLYR